MNLVERTVQLRELQAATARAFKAHGEIVLVAGEAGAGKTALLGEYVSQLQPGTSCGWGGCDALHTPRPLGPLIDMAGALGPEFRTLVRETEQASDLFVGLIEAIERLGSGIVLVFEDVHWADNATLDLLKYLCRRVLALKVLVVISYRNDEVGPAHPLSTLIGDLPNRVVRRLELTGLSPHGVEALAAQYGRSAEGVHALTNGNAFFATELLSQPQASGSGLSPSIRAVILTRMARLTPSEQELVMALSVVPYAIDRTLLRHVETAFGHSLPAACLNSGILEEQPDGSVRFRHELARLAVLSNMTPTQERALNARILGVLCSQPDLTEAHLHLVAHCALAAEDVAATLTYAPRAARRAAQMGAHKEAASHFADALRFVDRSDEGTAAQLYEDWAYEAGLADEITDAVIEARRTAVGLWQALGRQDKVGHNYRWLWRLHWYRGETEAAEVAEQAGLAVLELAPPCAELAMAYSTRSQVHFLNNRAREAVDWGRRALELARHFGDVATQVHAMTNIGSALLFRNDPAGRAYMEESLTLARRNNLHEHAARVYTNFSEYAILSRDFALAETLTSEGIAYDTRLTLDSWTYYLVGRQAQLRLEQGRLLDAVTISRGVLAITKLTLVMRVPALIALARTLSRLGQPEAEDRLAEALEAALAIQEPQYIIPVRFALLEHAYLASRFGEARSELDLVLQFDPAILQPYDHDTIALWASRLDVELPEAISYDPLGPTGLEIVGDALGAAHALQAMHILFDAALARIHHCGPEQSSELAAAVAEMEALGARAGADFGRSLAQKRGMESAMPRRRRGPYRAARSHPLGLTTREVAILQLLVDGSSNREIADRLSRSQRTVEHHVAAVLTKLNAANRMQAALRALSEPWILELQ